MANHSIISESALAAALTKLALEETARLESAYQADALPVSREVIESVRAGHQNEALRIIRRETRRVSSTSGVGRLLSLAACLLLITVGAFLVMDQPPAPDLPVTPLATQQIIFDRSIPIPPEWQGNYYPTWLPDNWSHCRVTTVENGQSASYYNSSNQLLYTFTEYSQITAFHPQDEAQLIYRQLNDRIAALTARGVSSFLAVWDVAETQTLEVYVNSTDDEAALRIAQSVEKINP